MKATDPTLKVKTNFEIARTAWNKVKILWTDISAKKTKMVD